MKKAFVLFICMFVLGLAGICILPGVILREADNVTLPEQVVLGDPAIVEGVTVTTVNDSMHHLLWQTQLVVGKEPVTEFDFSAKRRTGEARLRTQAWLEGSDYSCITLYNPMHGGFSGSSNGSVSLEGGMIEQSGLVDAYKELAAETKPGEEKTKQIFLSQYMEYVPIKVALDVMWEGEELSKAYSEYFKIPVSKDDMYSISVEKNKAGSITKVSGYPTRGNYTWSSVCARSEEACYFTFHPYTADDTKINTSLIPGGFGIYRQPYAIGAESVYMNPEELSMVYSLEEENYPIDSIFLDVNEAGQLLILIDTEGVTKLQVVDLSTFEMVQQTEILHPEGTKDYVSVARVKEDFLLLSYQDGYFALVDRNDERGYAHQFTIQVNEDDPLYWCYYAAQSDMDWDGSRLLFASCINRQYMQASCDVTLAVYDSTGKIYQGEYRSSLLTDQERECLYAWNTVEPWGEIPLTAAWPE